MEKLCFVYTTYRKMNVTPPVKPPRGIKPTKETSGLLISVIRALSASETNEQREIEKAKLEKEYKRSDQRLEELVSSHDQDLVEVMQIFSALSEKVTSSREKIHAVKENLNACKQLLRCKREELLNLWLEGIEHKQVLHLLKHVSSDSCGRTISLTEPELLPLSNTSHDTSTDQ
ncbi:exocyst complex component secretory 8 isoform X1 [Temnothorax americanus]|uniref:exocyst complex component secretory 8 isoform X1 n=2 Tax=Temnothorax americanus TaxID=1964332 RepID=UPI0040696101